MARAEGFDFFPFVVETTGGIGAFAVAFAERVASADLEEGKWTYAEVYNGLLTSVSVAVQQGNCEIVREGIRVARFPLGTNLPSGLLCVCL